MPIFMPPVVPVSDGPAYAWIDWQGTVYDLTQVSSPSVFVSRGSTGLGAPPVTVVDDKLTFIPGSAVRHLQTLPAKMTIPITLVAATMSDLLTAHANLRRWFYTGDERSRKPGYFRVTRPDGTIRQRLCYNAGGLEGDLSQGGPNWAITTVDLFAPDGYASAPSDTVLTYGAADFSPATISLSNLGEIDAYPIWTITGPGSTIVIANNTTGKLWAWGSTLAPGGILRVDSRPTSQRTTPPVINGSGGNEFASIVAPSDVTWTLVPGTNVIEINITGATGATQVQLGYRVRDMGMLR